MSEKLLPDYKPSKTNNHHAPLSVESDPDLTAGDLMADDLTETTEESQPTETLPGDAPPTGSLPQPRSGRRLRLVLLAALVGAALIGTILIRRQGQSAKVDPPVAETALPNILPTETVTVEPVSSYSISQSYTGVVEAQRTSELSFEQSGLLVDLRVEEGTQVSTEETIARLDTSQLEAQRSGLVAQRGQAEAVLTELQNGPRQETIAATRASLAQEKARLQELQTGPRIEDIDAARSRVRDLEEQLELARLQTQRRDNLYREGAISLEQFDEASTQEDALRARLAASRSELEELQTGTRPEQIQAQQAQVQSVQSQLDELLAGTRREQIQAQQAQVQQITAQIAEIDILLDKNILRTPFAGTVSIRYLDEGTVVSPGQAVVRLVEATRPEARIGVPPSVVSRLTPGRQYPVQVNGNTYEATILSILPELDSATRTRTVILALPETAAPGTIARLEITRTQPASGYWLPTAALVRGERGLWASYVLVSPSEDDDLPPGTYQLERRDVEVLHTEGDRSLVRGVLQSGDRVVTSGTQQFVPGQFVQLGDGV